MLYKHHIDLTTAFIMCIVLHVNWQTKMDFWGVIRTRFPGRQEWYTLLAFPFSHAIIFVSQKQHRVPVGGTVKTRR